MNVAFLNAQSKYIYCYDKETKKPIPFATINSSHNYFFGITDYDGKINIDTLLTCIIIQHVSYGQKIVSAKELYNTDTLFFSRQVNELSEVIVKPIDDDYYINILNNILKKYRKRTEDSTLSYAYYLQSGIVNPREIIMSLVSTNYSANNGFLFDNNYVLDGVSWVDDSNMFFNLSTDQFILGFNPLAKKASSSLYWMPTNVNKLKANNRTQIHIRRGQGDTVDVLIQTKIEKKSVTVRFLANEKRILSVFLSYCPKESPFTTLNDNEFVIDKIEVRYFFSQNNVPENINFYIKPNLGTGLDEIYGYFKEISLTTEKYYSLQFGNFRPANFYQHLLFRNGSIVGNFFLNSSNGLDSIFYFPNNIDKIKNKSNFNKTAFAKYFLIPNLYFWSRNDIFNNAINVKEFESKYFQRNGKLQRIQNELDFNWLFNFTYCYDTIVCNSYPTFIDVSQNKLNILNGNSAFNVILGKKLLFDIMELGRQSVIDSISVISSSDKKIVTRFIQRKYSESKKLMEFYSEKILDNCFYIEDIFRLNTIVHNGLGVDNLAAFLEQETFESIDFNELIKILTSYEQYFLKNCFNDSIENYYYRQLYKYSSIVLFQFKNKNNVDNKQLGILYGLLANSAIHIIEEKENACEYLRKYREYFPNAFLSLPSGIKNYLVTYFEHYCNGR